MKKIGFIYNEANDAETSTEENDNLDMGTAETIEEENGENGFFDKLGKIASSVMEKLNPVTKFITEPFSEFKENLNGNSHGDTTVRTVEKAAFKKVSEFFDRIHNFFNAHVHGFGRWIIKAIGFILGAAFLGFSVFLAIKIFPTVLMLLATIFASTLITSLVLRIVNCVFFRKEKTVEA